MSRKIIVICTTVVAFAASSVIATATSANPVLTHPTGTVLKPGVLIRGHQVNSPSKLTSEGTDPASVLLECSNATLTGELTQNETTKSPSIEGNITKAEFSGTGQLVNGVQECTGSFGNIIVVTTGANGVPWCLRSIKASDEFEIRGGKCTEAARNIAFVLNSTNIGECKYEKANFVGTFTTHSTGDAILTLTHAGPATKVAGGFLCPSSGYLDMSFTLETDTKITEELYLSS